MAVIHTMNIVLVEPEIPPNTGNIIRLAANTGCQMHLIRPLGFELDDKRLRRAGLDYSEFCDLNIYDHWQAFIDEAQPIQLYTISTKGQRYYHDVTFRPNDYIVFGSETKGLTTAIREHAGLAHVIRIPMQAESRSMNLSNAVAVVIYEAWRQQGFPSAV